MKMSNIWTPAYQAPHPSTVSGLSSLGDKILQAIYHENNTKSRKFTTNNNYKTDYKQEFNDNCLWREKLTHKYFLEKENSLHPVGIFDTEDTNLENNNAPNHNTQTSLNNFTTVDDLFDYSINRCSMKTPSPCSNTEIVDKTIQMNRSKTGGFPSPDMEFDDEVLYSMPYTIKNKDHENKSDKTKVDGDYENESHFGKYSHVDLLKNSNQNELQSNFKDNKFSVDDLFVISQIKESQKYKNNIFKNNNIKDQCFKMVDSNKKKPQRSGKKATWAEKQFKGNTKITSYFQSVSLGKETEKNNFVLRSTDFTKSNQFKIGLQPDTNKYCIDSPNNKNIGINNATVCNNENNITEKITQLFNRNISCKTDLQDTRHVSKYMNENKRLQEKDSINSGLSLPEQDLLTCVENETDSNVLNLNLNPKMLTIDTHDNKYTNVNSGSDLFSPAIVIDEKEKEINNILNKNELCKKDFENCNIDNNKPFLLSVLSDSENEKKWVDKQINKMENVHCEEKLSPARSIDLFASQDSLEINKSKRSYAANNIGELIELDQSEKNLENDSESYSNDVTMCRKQNHKIEENDIVKSIISARLLNYAYGEAIQQQKDRKLNSGLNMLNYSTVTNQNKTICDTNSNLLSTNSTSKKPCDDFKEIEMRTQGEVWIECDQKNIDLNNTQDKSKEKQNNNNSYMGKIENNTFCHYNKINDKSKFKEMINSKVVYTENESTNTNQSVNNLQFHRVMKTNIETNTSDSPSKRVKYDSVTNVKSQNSNVVSNQSDCKINKPQFKGVLQFVSTKNKNKTSLKLKNKANSMLDDDAEKYITNNCMSTSNEIKKIENPLELISLMSNRNKLENSKKKSVTIPDMFNKKFSECKFSRNNIGVGKSEMQNRKKVFVPPLKKVTEAQELPTQINNFNFITLNYQNIALMEEKLKSNDIKQIIITVVYRLVVSSLSSINLVVMIDNEDTINLRKLTRINTKDGYTLLNKPKPSKVSYCYPNGLMILVNLQHCCEYWYCNLSPTFWSDKSLQNIREFMDCVFSSRCKGRKICYEAQAVCMLIMDSFQFKVYEECKGWTMQDPMIGCWLLNPDNPPQNFKKALENLGMDLNVMESASGCDAKTQACILLPILGLMMDCVEQKLMKSSLWSLFIDMETKLLPILAVMECQSICVDKNKLEDAAVVLEKRLCQVQEAAYKAAGRPFQINSHVQLRQVLYDELQLDTKHSIKVKQTTQQGSKSTSEPMMKLLENVHPLPKIILEHRQLQKIKSTYVDGILQHLRKDNTVSTTWDQIGAATGRITSSNPNLQGIPKQAINLEGALISPRASFISRTGCSFLAADFKHIEFRVFAHYTQDEGLLCTFRDSDDIFQTLAHMWLGHSGTTERDKTKKIVYSVMYGAGAVKVAEYLHVDIDEANKIINSFLLKFPCLRTLSNKVINQCRTQGYLHTIAGRLRLFPNITSTNSVLRSYSERQAINFLIQGSAADICKAAMLNCEASLSNPSLGSKLLLQIHDELLWEVADNQLHIVGEKVKLAMEYNQQWGELRVPIPVTIAVGKNWADLKPVLDFTSKFDI